MTYEGKLREVGSMEKIRLGVILQISNGKTKDGVRLTVLPTGQEAMSTK